ncbi:MAG: MBOAT family protein, partial [Eudoraea sp.]|nr:MBOAT family protein [Eudoraea sp.]
FYGWWDWRFLFLIVFSGLIDFFAAKLIDRHRNKGQIILIFSLFVNFSCLSIFKYSTFLAEQIEHFLLLFSVNANIKESLPAFTYILPVGISFYTFQSISYTVDVYRNKLKPTPNILHFFSYLVMFPQLVAGPIVRAKDFLQQLSQKREISTLTFWNGIKLILLGYFQKTVLADNLGVFVNEAFAGMDNGNGLYWWVVMSCFAFQIYFDFSGYSQIARGLAKLMGYHFKMNFNHPYLSVSMRDFWSRWHISLSTWFRDYVYIPLGGNKKGRVRSHINMWITMLLSGLWHGAAINFVLWGAYHAFALSAERVIDGTFKNTAYKKGKILRWGTTMFTVLIGWALFRAATFEQFIFILKSMFYPDFSLLFLTANLNLLFFIALALWYEGGYFLTKHVPLIPKDKKAFIESFKFAIILACILFLRGPEQEFIYFQF